MKKREPLLNAIVKIIDGQPTDELIPVLIIVVARALVSDAEGDPDKLEAVGSKFCRLVQDNAEEMLREGSVH